MSEPVTGMFCMPGRHAVTFSEPVADCRFGMLPTGWTMVRASVTPTGEWYASRTSAAQVLCCPEHPLGPPQTG